MAIGSFPKNFIEAGAQTHKLDLKEYDTWWTVEYDSIKHGDHQLSSKKGYAILDTGTSLLTIGYHDYMDFRKQF